MRENAVTAKISSIPSSLPAGTYYAVADVSSAAGTSSAAASTATVTVAPPFITLSSPSVVPPKSVKPGKKTAAVLTIVNGGNIVASGPMEVVFSARPPGTSGSADIALQTVPVKIKIKPNGTARVKTAFVVQATLAAGIYSLVAQIDAANAFDETALPSPIVSLTTFTVL